MDFSESMPPGNQFAIELASWRDLNALRHLEKICFPKDAWPLWDIAGVLTLPHVVRLKATVAGEMVGFVAGDERPAERLAWIATIGVLPEYRNREIGRALLLACEARLRVSRVRLNVRVENDEAIRLYNDTGYRNVGVWPGYYADGGDALVMEKQLAG